MFYAIVDKKEARILDIEMKYVYEVYLHKSFSQAAKTLFVSQSAVSLMVRRAEERTGCQIFDRSTIPFTLTEEGKFYISNVEKLRKVENDLYAYFDDRRQLRTGRLTLASSTFYCSYYLTRIANAFKKKYPGIHFDIMEGDGAYLKQWLLNGRIDFLFSAIPIEEKDMRHCFFAFEDLVLAVPAAFVDVNRRIASYQLSYECVRTGDFLKDEYRAVPLWELSESPFVTLTREGSELYRRSYSICRNAGFTPKVELYLSQIMTAYYMVAAGVGAAFVRSSLLNMVPENKDVIFYKVGDPLARRPINLVYNGNRYINHAMQAFLNFIDTLPAPYRV